MSSRRALYDKSVRLRGFIIRRSREITLRFLRWSPCIQNRLDLGDFNMNLLDEVFGIDLRWRIND